MQDSRMEQDQLIERYVLGKLSEADAEEFEAHFLSNPALIEQIETAQRIHQGLVLVEGEQPQRVQATASKSVQRSFRHYFRWLLTPIPAYGAIAMLTAAVPLVVLLQPPINPSDTTLAHFSTTATRGAENIGLIELGSVEGQVAILLKIKNPRHPNYKLKLYLENRISLVWESKPFEVGALREKLVLIPAKNLVPGRYALKTFGIDAKGRESAVDFCHYSEVCH